MNEKSVYTDVLLHKIVGQVDESVLGQSLDVTDFRDLFMLAINDAVIFVTTAFYVHISLANKMGIKQMYNQSKHKCVNCGYIPCYPQHTLRTPTVVLYGNCTSFLCRPSAAALLF